MSVFVDISDISIHARRTVIQESYAQLGDILDNEQGVEGFFDYHDEWDNEEADDFEYEVEVEGVISASAHKRHHEEKQAVIDRQKEQIKRLHKEASDMADTIAKLKSHMHKNNVEGLKLLLKGEEE